MRHETQLSQQTQWKSGWALIVESLKAEESGQSNLAKAALNPLTMGGMGTLI